MQQSAEAGSKGKRAREDGGGMGRSRGVEAVMWRPVGREPGSSSGSKHGGRDGGRRFCEWGADGARRSEGERESARVGGASETQVSKNIWDHQGA